MSRRRGLKKPVVESAAPRDGTPLGHLSDAELMKELARRRVARGKVDLAALEEFAEGAQQQMGAETLEAAVAALPPEDTTPKRCPKCGRPVPVKARGRVRSVLTVAGELRVVRNYHYCELCKHGFYPRDRELNLPENGDISDAMERRILDFGVNDTFEAAAQRWSIHYPSAISPNLVRRVVDRVGERVEHAHSELSLQRACRPTPEQLPSALVVAADGSMLLTREEAWKEAKVAVVARGDDIVRVKKRGTVSAARYVAEFGQEDFRKKLGAALEAERADEIPNVVWLGDGAHENWTMAKELCPFAVQVLDLPHAIQNGVSCGKALLGEGDPGVGDWELRIKQLVDAPSPDAAIRELMDCLPHATTEDQLAALDRLVGYYRTNEKRMRYVAFREKGLPVGSGIVESAHRHVLQVRMKRAGQRWALRRAKQMARLRAIYRTAGPLRFHGAVRDALKAPPMRAHRQLPNGPRRAKHAYAPSRVSPYGRLAASN